MKQFDSYEIAGVIAPGVVVLVAAGLIWPEYLGNIQRLDVTVGGLGLTVLLAYVAGHLLQAIGNLFEMVWWKIRGGWPSDWPRSGKGNLLANAQMAKLQERIRVDLGYADLRIDSGLPAQSWLPIFSQIYAIIRAAGKDGRAHTFNGNYGLFRGIVAAALVSSLALLIVHGWGAWRIALAFALAAGLALFRMHRFAVHYARETYVQFLALPSNTGSGQAKGGV